MLEALLKTTIRRPSDYVRRIKTGQDLLDLGIKPKTSSQAMSLITHKRLEALRDSIKGSIDNEMLGYWKPAVKYDGKSYSLEDGVVADEQLGHKVKFNFSYEGANAISGNNKKQINVKNGDILTLVNFEDNIITARYDSGENKDYQVRFKMGNKFEQYEVSSNGQFAPLDEDNVVRTESMKQFFPNTVFDQVATEDLIIGLLMGKDMVFEGPPGGGKSCVSKDIMELAKQQKYIFTVKECLANCSPFSIFDEDFAKIVPACPKCKIKYDANTDPDTNFKATGVYTFPRPGDVPTIVALYGSGFGMERKEGTKKLNRMHLIGFKIPKLDGSTTKGRESESDPEGFHEGDLPRTNNGILNIEEADELDSATQHSLFMALADETVKPDQLRFDYPANALVLLTANDAMSFEEALIDRILKFYINYPEDSDTSYEITKVSYHGQSIDVSDAPIQDINKLDPMDIRKIFMPEILERAVDRFYMKFRAEYQGDGITPIVASNRSKMDALDAARTKLLVDSIFVEDAPKIALAGHAKQGILYAMVSRMRDANPKRKDKHVKDVVKFLNEQFPKLVKAEQDTWWCRLYKHVGTFNQSIPEYQKSFEHELNLYKEDLTHANKTFMDVGLAYHNQGRQKEQVQAARLEYPFMD